MESLRDERCDRKGRSGRRVKLAGVDRRGQRFVTCDRVRRAVFRHAEFLYTPAAAIADTAVVQRFRNRPS